MTEGTTHGRDLSLDVLRAVAVLLVLVRHSPVQPADHPGILAGLLRAGQLGGWVGVDLFFVLSGFLISGLLFGEYQRTREIRVRRFLIRRSLKIYPAFYVLILITVLQGYWAAGQVPVPLVLSEVLYVQNYFPRMWDHTWSLAVEEHFYLFLPVVLLLMLRTSGRGAQNPFRSFPRLVAIVAVGCLAVRVATAVAKPFVFDTHVAPTHLRIDALMFGCLLSYVWHFAPEKFRATASRWRVPLALAGCAFLLPPFLFPLELLLMVGPGLTLFYLGAGMLLVAVFQQVPSTPLTRLASFIGRHSYSIYLWHFAVLIWLVPLTEIAIGRAFPPFLAFGYYVGSACLVGVVMARAVELPVVALRDRWFPAREQEPLSPAASSESPAAHS